MWYELSSEYIDPWKTLEGKERSNLADYGIVILLLLNVVGYGTSIFVRLLTMLIMLEMICTCWSGLNGMKRILNKCIGAYSHGWLIMCAYRCLCMCNGLYDMLRRRNLGNDSPMFKAINNVFSFNNYSRNNFLISLIEWSWIE